MGEKTSSRRRLIALGASAGTMVLAGCSGGNTDGSNPSSGGGSSGSVLLEVSDQNGDGSSLTVTRASAPTDFYIDVHMTGGDTGGISDTYGGGATPTNVEISLDPALQNDATLEVAIHNATNDNHIGDRAEIQYTVTG